MHGSNHNTSDTTILKRKGRGGEVGEASHGVRPAAARRRGPGVQVLPHVPGGVELASRAAPAAPPPGGEAVRVPERVGVRIRLRVGVGEACPAGGAARGEELGGARHGRVDEAGAGAGAVAGQRAEIWLVGWIKFPVAFFNAAACLFWGKGWRETSGGRCEEAACDGGRRRPRPVDWTATGARAGLEISVVGSSSLWSVMAVDASRGRQDHGKTASSVSSGAGPFAACSWAADPHRLGPKLIS
jgi:hypothetical protein